MTARATYLLAAALCCACAVAYGDKETSSSSSPETEPEASPPKSKSPESDNTTGVADPQEDENNTSSGAGSSEVEEEGGSPDDSSANRSSSSEGAPAADDEAQDEGTHEHADAGEDGASQEGAGITADAVRTVCALAEQLRGVGVSTATLWSRVNVSVARAAEHESTADGAAAAAVAANASRLAHGVARAARELATVVAGLMDEVAASSAPEDTREAARSCVGPAANVSSDSLDEVWNAAAEVLGGDALDFLTARVSGLVGGLRELEAAAVTAEGAEADGKAASEGSCSAMSLVVASAALLLAARV
ncbi:hypothetical protein, conserved in T. vivax [Trypanosoma vivax Y486]|nr:hypothetical protein, conserved in T. vivax [Trypanosoma vivax Y486]CCD21451.1 hypothetical protein, conserved in T. vivax [Trypanosoma vivax Y486]|eukprot:CCD20611.1 hypothetical protein, conserved in T. vivax [Trypanosoma vivax Y486]